MANLRQTYSRSEKTGRVKHGGPADISSDDLSLPPFPVNRMLAALFGSESYFIGRLRFPAGVSVMACARRPG
jgi:hypothetical protein